MVPIYEYKCTDCSTQFELRHGFDTETELPCPK
ncbi:MAG: FmdB family zinc ribbon protein, partial [Dehalococcoidales bacterium]